MDELDDDCKCPGPLVKRMTAEGVTVELCPATKGMLFDPGDVASYFDLEHDLPVLARENATPTGRSWRCPKHEHGRLVEYRYPALDDLQLDLCDVGGCVWFDRGEVPRFEVLVARLDAPKSNVIKVFERLRASGWRSLWGGGDR